MPVTFSPEELASVKANYDAYTTSHKQQPKKTAQTKKRPGGVNGLLQGLLPIAGGALGAIGGTFLGGPAGTIAGGAAGSALGEGLRERLGGEKLNAKSIAGQAAFGAIPGIGSGVKALRAGGGAASLIGRGAATAAPEVVKGGKVANALYNKGVMTEARSGGFGQGEKLTGGTSQGFRDSEAISQNLTKEGIPAGNASARQIAVGDRLQQHATNIDKAVEANNPKLLDAQKSDTLGRVQKSIVGGENGKGIPGYIVGKNANSDYANALAKQYSGIKDAKGQLAFKRKLDQDAINYGRNSASAEPIREQIAKAFRKEVNKDFGEMVPEAKAASQSYSKLHDANEFLKQAARDKSNAATQNGGGLASRVLTSDIAETAKSKGGKVMATLGKAIGAAPGEAGVAPVANASAGTASNILGGFTGGNIAKQSLKQATPRLLLGGLGGGNQQEDVPATNVADQLNNSGLDLTQSLDPNQTAESTLNEQSPYSQEALMADVARDPKNTSTYLSLYKELNPDAGTAKTGAPNITKVTAQQYGLAKSGSDALQQLAGMIQSDPNVVTRTATPGRQLPIVGGAISNAAGTGSYDAIGYNIADSILRLRTGAQANESEVKKLQSQIMPRAGDSPETIKTKLNQINTIFSGVLNIAGGPSSGSPDLVDANSVGL